MESKPTPVKTNSTKAKPGKGLTKPTMDATQQTVESTQRASDDVEISHVGDIEPAQQTIDESKPLIGSSIATPSPVKKVKRVKKQTTKKELESTNRTLELTQRTLDETANPEIESPLDPSRLKGKRAKRLQNMHDFVDETAKLQGNLMFKKECHFSLAKHRLAAIHLKSWHFWTFTVPASTITMATGIMAFLATSDLFQERTNDILNVVVGCLAFVVVFINTLSARLKFDIRAEMHQGATIDLRDLKEDLENAVNRSQVMLTHLTNVSKINRSRLVTGVEKGKSKDRGRSKSKDRGKNKSKTTSVAMDGNIYDGDVHSTNSKGSGDQSDVDEECENLKRIFDGIQLRYNQCLKGCKSSVPLKINSAFEQLDSRLNTTMTLLGHERLKSVYGPHFENTIYFQACNDLGLRFSGFVGWPFFLPNPARAVDETMEKLKRNLSIDYWDGVLVAEEP